MLILGERGSLVLVDERLVGTLPLSVPLLLSAGIKWCWSWRAAQAAGPGHSLGVELAVAQLGR